MSLSITPQNRQRLREALRRERVFYQVYPDLTWHPADTSLSWFEIALHAEADGYQPPENPRSREVFSLLIELAELLTQQIHFRGPYEVDLSASYWTLHPPGCGDPSRTRVSRSLSLVISNTAPYRKGDEPPLLSEMTTQLSLFGIFPTEIERPK